MSVEHINGKPPCLIKDAKTMDFMRQGMVYSTYAMEVISELKQRDFNIPLNGITVGDNWIQYHLLRTNPIDRKETDMLKTNPHILFGHSTDILPRCNYNNLDEVPDKNSLLDIITMLERLSDLVDDTHRDYQTVINNVFLIDRTSVFFPAINEDDIVSKYQALKYKGESIRLIDSDIRVYCIRGGHGVKIMGDCVTRNNPIE